LDITRPQNRFDLRSQNRTSGTTNQVTQETEILRFSQHFDLSSMWRLGIVTQLPFVARQTASSNGSVAVSEFGIGDAFVEPTLVRKIDAQWSIVFGARLARRRANSAPLIDPASFNRSSFSAALKATTRRSSSRAACAC
jgi:hypothetical protein